MQLDTISSLRSTYEGIITNKWKSSRQKKNNRRIILSPLLKAFSQFELLPTTHMATYVTPRVIICLHYLLKGQIRKLEFFHHDKYLFKNFVSSFKLDKNMLFARFHWIHVWKIFPPLVWHAFFKFLANFNFE